MFRSLLLVLVLSVVSQLNLTSQSCAVKLRNAENEFNAGRVEGVPALLEECLASGFTKVEELKAYQLIIRSYLYDDRTSLAESTMLEFLRKHPEYQVSPTDNVEFVYLLNKYNIKPIIQVGINIGGQSTFITGITPLNTNDGDVAPDYGNEQLSLTAGLEVLVRINDKIEIGAGVDYSEVTFSKSSDYLNYATNLYTEKQRRIETPVHIYYKPVSFGSFFPYIKGGTGVALNLSTTGDFMQTNLDINNVISRPATQETIDGRQFLDPFVSVGLGCRLKLPHSYAFVDVSTRIGTQIQSKASEPANPEYFYGITDDLFHLNTVRFNIGYIYIFYKPTRREE
jgi:hypothetical protein